MKLSVRAITTADIEPLVNYWTSRSEEAMVKMGIDIAHGPEEEPIRQMLHQQVATSLAEKSSYATIWLIDGKAIGHCNVNEIVFGDHAYMHLHMWDALNRKRGIGAQLVGLSVHHFFEKLELTELFCQPYALNPAPNKTLPKVGFVLKKTFVGVPSSWCFEQEINQWYMSREMWMNKNG